MNNSSMSRAEETGRMKQCKACTVRPSYKSSQTCLSWRGGIAIPSLQPLWGRHWQSTKLNLKWHVHRSGSHRHGFCKWHLMPCANVQKELRWINARGRQASAAKAYPARYGGRVMKVNFARHLTRELGRAAVCHWALLTRARVA